MADFVRAHLPGVGPDPVRSSVCMYTMSADGYFILDQRDGAHVAAGPSGHGFKFAPVLGEILAERLLGLPDRWVLDVFRVR